jgi:hypothetical protein
MPLNSESVRVMCYISQCPTQASNLIDLILHTPCVVCDLEHGAGTQSRHPTLATTATAVQHGGAVGDDDEREDDGG